MLSVDVLSAAVKLESEFQHSRLQGSVTLQSTCMKTKNLTALRKFPICNHLHDPVHHFSGIYKIGGDACLLEESVHESGQFHGFMGISSKEISSRTSLMSMTPVMP